MMAKRMKKCIALVLTASVLVSGGAGSAADAADKSVVVTPYAGLWKYYGQNKTFVEDEHYSLSEEVPSEAGEWKLTIDGEEIGEHRYVVTGSAVSASAVRLADPSPVFEVRRYTADALVEDETEIHTSTDSIALAAPSGYLISGEKQDGEWNWQSELHTGELQEGENVITYYLRSNKNDSTRKAIDDRPKQITITVDSIPPTVTSLLGGNVCTDVQADGSITGSEPGMFYYLVVPASTYADITTEYIQECVTGGHGIAGYGRVDGQKASALQINGLTAQTEYVIYAYMTDKAGNESPVVTSAPFVTDKMNLQGEVEIQGTVETDNVLTANPRLTSVDTGELSYQWYRIKLDEDRESFEAVYDETGGAEEDDLEADLSDDEEDEEDEAEAEGDDDGNDSEAFHILADTEGSGDLSIDNAEEIKAATGSAYKVTREDIGYRLMVSVRAANYSGYVQGQTSTFVPKMMPKYTLPVVASAKYQPTRKLSAISLPKNWSWVDSSIVPVYGNSGYRAKYTPEERGIYKTVIVRLKVPVTKRALKRSMLKVKKSVAYTGKAIKDSVTLKDGKKKLQVKKDYRITFSHNVAVGKAYFQVKGIGNYSGKLKSTFKIKKKSVKKLTCQFDGKKAHTGKPRKARLIIKNGSVRLKKGKDYKEKYTKNVDMGRAKITVRGIGKYYGKRTIRFDIVPRKPSIKKVVRNKQAFRLKFKDRDEVSGYRVFVSTTSSFSKSTTQEYDTQGDEFGIRGLKKGTVYYARVKAYYKKKGNRYESAYSSKKKIKVK